RHPGPHPAGTEAGVRDPAAAGLMRPPPVHLVRPAQGGDVPRLIWGCWGEPRPPGAATARERLTPAAPWRSRLANPPHQPETRANRRVIPSELQSSAFNFTAQELPLSWKRV